jgi:hypothetical protein
VQRLAAEVRTGAHPDAVRGQLAAMKSDGRVWRRKVGCLRYWRFVHAHHSAEDHLLLLVLRRADPSMTPVTDRLEADHRAVPSSTR